MNLILNTPVKGFEEIKQKDENKNDFWSARDYFEVLRYSRWEDFQALINRAKKACFVSGQNIEDHFREVPKMVSTGSDARRKIQDFKLSRYACYLIAQNGDPTKMSQIALAQTYFAVQTRKQEILQDQMAAQEVERAQKRIAVREQVKVSNKKLFSAAKKSGVSNFGEFNDAGYLGLYGMKLSEIEKTKNLKKGELLDRAGRVELAANLFRITQTEEKLISDKVASQAKANQVHNMVGGKVRQTIKDIGGKMPEKMLPEKHIKEVKKDLKKISKRPGGKVKQIKK